MDRIKGLELLFNLEKNNLKSKEDCVVAALHCLLINRGFQCVGKGEEWPESVSTTTELLPSDWNSDQNVYALRYITDDKKSRILLKATKMEHILQADVVMNEDDVASMSVPVENHIDTYGEYCTTYKDLKSLSESFVNDVMKKLQPEPAKEPEQKSTGRSREESRKEPEPIPIAPPPKMPSQLLEERSRPRMGRFPNVGGNDLDPLGRGGGGMLVDPTSMGFPGRGPTLPQFGVGGPGGLPRGAVPPGARFDPFMPPNFGRGGGFEPNPDHMKPPDYDDYFM